MRLETYTERVRRTRQTENGTEIYYENVVKQRVVQEPSDLFADGVDPTVSPTTPPAVMADGEDDLLDEHLIYLPNIVDQGGSVFAASTPDPPEAETNASVLAPTAFLPLIANGTDLPPPRRPTFEEGAALARIYDNSLLGVSQSDALIAKRDELRIQVEGLEKLLRDIREDEVNYVGLTEDEVATLIETYTDQWLEDPAVFGGDDLTPLEREDQLAAVHANILTDLGLIPDDLLETNDAFTRQTLIVQFTDALLAIVDGTTILGLGNTGSVDAVDGSKDAMHIRAAADEFLRLVDAVGADTVKIALGEDVYNRVVTVLTEEVGTTYVREFENDPEAAVKAIEAFETNWRSKLQALFAASGEVGQIGEAWAIMRDAGRVAQKGDWDAIMRRLDANPLASRFGGFVAFTSLLSVGERTDDAGATMASILGAVADTTVARRTRIGLLRLSKAAELRGFADVAGSIGFTLGGVADALALLDSVQRRDLFGAGRDAAFMAGNFLALAPKIGGRLASKANAIAAVLVAASTIHDFIKGIIDHNQYENANRARLRETFSQLQAGREFEDFVASNFESDFRLQFAEQIFRRFAERTGAGGESIGHDYVILENEWAIFEVGGPALALID